MKNNMTIPLKIKNRMTLVVVVQPLNCNDALQPLGPLYTRLLCPPLPPEFAQIHVH